MIVLKELIHQLAKPEHSEKGRLYAPLAMDARSFVFADAVGAKLESQTDLIYQLPFRTCAIEVAGKQPVFTYGDGQRCYGILIHERSAGDYLFAGIMQTPDDRFGIAFEATTSKSMYARGFVRIANSYFDCIPKQEICTEKVNERIKVRIGGRKEFIKIREVIHISPKKLRGTRGPNGGELDFSHRFEVRGHWRQITGIGKDRDGSYGVKGLTWVLPHVRGPESKPLVVKQRVVHGYV